MTQGVQDQRNSKIKQSCWLITTQKWTQEVKTWVSVQGVTKREPMLM